MNLPFTPPQFFEVMHRYNEGVWPAQLALNAVALLSIAVLAVRPRSRDAFIAALLALLWMWSGVVYHLRYFYEINPAAALFGALSVAGAAVFAWSGVRYPHLRFECTVSLRSVLGGALLAYALVIYPLLAWTFGHRYPETPTFGMPCPTTIFTVGMLAFARPPVPRSVFVAPLLWAAIGSQAAFSFGIYEDLGLLGAGIAAAWLAVQSNAKARFA